MSLSAGAGRSLPKGLQFHHVGVACRDVEAEAAHYRALGFKRETKTFDDPIQKIRGFFMTNGVFRVELLEPSDAGSPIEIYLKRGVQMYHQAYEARDFSGTIARFVRAGHMLVVPPVYAVAFRRKVAFLMLRNMALVELIEARTSF